MTKLIFIVLVFYPTVFFGQKTFDTAKIQAKYSQYFQLYYFLDTQRIDIDKTYFNYKDIKNFSVKKDTVTFYARTPLCTIKISTKTRNRQLVNLAECRLKNSNTDTNRLYKFIIDGKLIIDTSNIRIDPTFVKSITINNHKEINLSKPVTYFIITTKK